MTALKKPLLAAALALCATFASAAPVSIAFDADGTAVFWSKPAKGSFVDEYLFSVPFLQSSLSGSVTTSLSGQKDIDFTRIYITDGSSTLFDFLQTSTDETGSEQWTLNNAGLLAGMQYHLFLEGSSALPATMYTGEMSVVAAVPEPATLALVLGGLAAAGAIGRRRRG